MSLVLQKLSDIFLLCCCFASLIPRDRLALVVVRPAVSPTLKAASQELSNLPRQPWFLVGNTLLLVFSVLHHLYTLQCMLRQPQCTPGCLSGCSICCFFENGPISAVKTVL